MLSEDVRKLYHNLLNGLRFTLINLGQCQKIKSNAHSIVTLKTNIVLKKIEIRQITMYVTTVFQIVLQIFTASNTV